MKCCCAKLMNSPLLLSRERAIEIGYVHTDDEAQDGCIDDRI